MKLTTAIRSEIAQLIISKIANGSISSPIIEVYDGAEPASMGQTITDTLLAELALTNTAANETDGEITFEPISNDNSANAGGDQKWARILDRDGAEVLYLTAGGPGDGAELTLNTSTITENGPVAITSGTITIGGA
ncbi:hypothetical protein [Marinobacter adhaerens]|uniref:Uncharacterized protein n=2 Tax=Marinobacter adhaerens TaxID=1033846 RepID=A0ABX8IF81_9GAMM|nr:hypothetical protein [Marinobacter adhaerens]QWV11775.1 hypothetical protein KQ249_13890 [Marinobacter adhaerens]